MDGWLLGIAAIIGAIGVAALPIYVARNTNAFNAMKFAAERADKNTADALVEARAMRDETRKYGERIDEVASTVAGVKSAVAVVQKQTDGAMHLITELAKKEGISIGTEIGREVGRAEVHQEQAVVAEAVAADRVANGTPKP